MAMEPDPVCTIESCPWNGQPMSAHPRRDRSHIPDYIEEPWWHGMKDWQIDKVLYRDPDRQD